MSVKGLYHICLVCTSILFVDSTSIIITEATVSCLVEV